MNSLVIDQQTEVINELCEKISKAQKQAKKGIKAQKVSLLFIVQYNYSFLYKNLMTLIINLSH